MPGQEQAVLLRELLLVEWDYWERNGEVPSAQAYLERFPDFREVVMHVAEPSRSGDETACRVGQYIGRYRIERTIGQGAFGTVYVAWDEKLERPVAIKSLHSEVLAACHNGEQILAEARAAAKLRHPGIVAVYDVLEGESGAPLIVMEYLAGETLRDALQTDGLTRLDVLEIVSQIADAVDFAHGHGFIHRDLKPSNIRFDGAGRPRVLDFGLAIHESIQKSRAGESAGSLAYMSPEQVRGESDWLDGRADVWALGIILYEVLSGRTPFSGVTIDQLGAEILCREPKPLRQIDSQVPAELERICLKCLRKDVAERYATAADFAEDLRGFLARGRQRQDRRSGREGGRCPDRGPSFKARPSSRRTSRGGDCRGHGVRRRSHLVWPSLPGILSLSETPSSICASGIRPRVAGEASESARSVCFRCGRAIRFVSKSS